MADRPSVWDFKNPEWRKYYQPTPKFDAARWGDQLMNELYGFSRQGVDMSFMTPEFLAAQRSQTIDPIQRSFALARKQGLNQSLRTGGPVGALYGSLAGQEGEAVGNQASRNFLTNTEFGADLAGRRFQQALAHQQASTGRQAMLDEEHRRTGGGFGKFLSGAAGLAGTLVGGGFNPLSIFRRRPNVQQLGQDYAQRNMGVAFP